VQDRLDLSAGELAVAILGIEGGPSSACRAAAPWQHGSGAAAGMVAVAIAAVTTVGYLGSFTGPPVIGALAELTSLPAALTLMLAACAAIALLERRLDSPTSIEHPQQQQQRGRRDRGHEQRSEASEPVGEERDHRRARPSAYRSVAPPTAKPNGTGRQQPQPRTWTRLPRRGMERSGLRTGPRTSAADRVDDALARLAERLARLTERAPAARDGDA
jgi:hypothetical protein